MNAELCEKGYVSCKGLVEPGLARVLYKMLLLLDLQPKIEAIAGCRLVSTYSYARLYFHGDTLIRHHDRVACEVSTSIHLGSDGGDGSLWFAPNTRVAMGEGDGAVYLGVRMDHWRERFTGNTLGQIFLHYVVAGGSMAAHSFDGHPERFPPSISERAAERAG